MSLSHEELTRIYKEANGELEAKGKPLTTERIFMAMQLAFDMGYTKGFIDGEESSDNYWNP